MPPSNYHQSNSAIPHIRVDDQFASFESLEWDPNEEFSTQAYSTSQLPDDFLPKEPSYHHRQFTQLQLQHQANSQFDHTQPAPAPVQLQRLQHQHPNHNHHHQQQQHNHQYQHHHQQQQQQQQQLQQQIAHKPLDRYVFAASHDSPFALGLPYHDPSAVPSNFEQYTLPAAVQDSGWRFAAPIDTSLAFAAGTQFIPPNSADTISNFDLLSRTSGSPLSDYNLQQRRSPSQPPQGFQLPNSLENFSSESSSSALNFGEMQHLSPVLNTPSSNNGEHTLALGGQHNYPAHGHYHPQPAVHGVDAVGEVDDEDAFTAQPPPVVATEHAVESDNEAAYDMASKSDQSDSDYKPSAKGKKGGRTTKRPSIGDRRRSSTAVTEGSSRVDKKKDRRQSGGTRSPRAHFHRTNSSGSNVSATALERPFSCPLQPYGCRATFSSKNEWKRHFTIQHLYLGFWRCDICPDHATRPNDFNRKDLFKQHLRRMHRGEKGGSTALSPITPMSGASRRGPAARIDDDDAFEAAMEEVRVRCWVQLRNAPAALACVFCEGADAGRAFDGPSCTEEWLEHVGRHLATAAARRDGRLATADGRREMEARWASDATLRAWLISEGLVEARADGRYVLADRVVASEAAQRRRSGMGAYADDE